MGWGICQLILDQFWRTLQFCRSAVPLCVCFQIIILYNILNLTAVNLKLKYCSSNEAFLLLLISMMMMMMIIIIIIELFIILANEQS